MVQITEYRNAKSLSADNSILDLEINHPDYGWIPYTLNIDDEDNTVNNDDLLALIGSDFVNYTPPTQEEIDAELALNIRQTRNMKLQHEVDPIAGNTLRWNELTSEQQAAWTQYRTDLLNVPQQSSFPQSVTWPVAPS
ncbi:MAG TPA: hypothetical protein DE276_07185 [Oceanospirillaceae bacterium]|nr:hypothetical protein [Oceanospirillaceae bacterium]|tara:strand:- start:85 stop:498 length:414 start_codon:yes stop_codon:yes gene_type:complete